MQAVVSKGLAEWLTNGYVHNSSGPFNLLSYVEGVNRNDLNLDVKDAIPDKTNITDRQYVLFYFPGSSSHFYARRRLIADLSSAIL